MTRAPGEQSGSGYRSPLLDLPGAVMASGADEGIAAHYGDPLGEQRALTTEVGLIDTSHWPVIEVSGPDRLRWLDALTSQRLADLPPGRTTQTLMLTSEGYIEHRLVVTEFGGHTWLSPEPGMTEMLLDELDTLRSALRVEIVDVRSEWAPLSMVGPDVGSVLAHLGVVEPPQPFTAVSMAGGGWLWRLPLPGGDVVPFVVPRALLRQVWRRLHRLGVRPTGHGAWEALRVAGRGPRVGYETDDHTFPQEVGWMGVAVDPGKTGYRGQEAMARIEAAGGVPRRLVLLRLDAGDGPLPPCGAAVESDGRPVGFLGTVVRHYQLGPIALALVAREVPDGAALTAGGVPATVEPSPGEAT